MFNTKSESKMAGPGYIILQIIRVLNIIALLLIAIASMIMLAMTLKTSNFFFFDGVSHFITFGIAMFLIVSETGFFQNYFIRNWPNFGPEAGFTYLGLAMIALGFNILGNLNKNATSVENLGLAMWREVIAAGILASLFGLVNIIATYVFCNSKEGISGRQVRSNGATTYPKSNFSVSSGSMRKSEGSPVLPTYRPTSPEERRNSRFGLKFPIRMSGISKPVANNQEQFSKWDDRSSPVAPEVQRPPTAMHPALHPPQPSYSRSSRYSEVSDMTRF
ncbi:hypothetical protein G7Y89_g14990 [Cudoniella acicularis]|uniref:DUF7598 domain-containing protein n=1 Tax=Cudoniella acicularis TaxID=354080 RepID=A0A8H4VQ99_9HELO|nr:hypothetical protein G7Y89_g14990 [Cudoniella acicularis]